MKFTYYSHTKDNRPDPNAVWLQSVGWVAGILATDAKPGMYMLYNFGTAVEVLRVEPKGKSTVLITTRENGKEYTSVRRGIIPCQYPK